jgi:hypothetical protein
MTNSLFDQMLDKPQRETVGSKTNMRFDYQQEWAFCKMLELHIAGNDYLVAFEFHDDVVFFDEEKDPKNVEFYQVKTKDKAEPRKLSSFTGRRGGGKSILGKLCSNIIGICKDYSIKLFLVSNHPYDFTSDVICAAELGKKDRDTVVKKIKEEMPDLDESFLDKLHFYVSKIPLETIQTHINGTTLNLFKSKFGENGSYNVFSWIRLIQGEIRRRNNVPSDEIKTVKDLHERKCVGKSFIDASLEEVAKLHRNAPDMQIIKNDLQNDGWKVPELLRLGKAFPRAVADYQDPSNSECAVLVKRISELLSGMDLTAPKLTQILDDVFMGLKNVPKIYNEKMYLNSLTILVYNEKL